MGQAFLLGMSISALMTASMTVDSPEKPESPLTRAQSPHPVGARTDPGLDSFGIQAAIQNTRLPAHMRRQLEHSILHSARKHGLDPRLILAIIQEESGFNPYAVSPVGAIGLMQVMPETGRYWLAKQGRFLGRSHNLFNPELNVEIGTSYLAAQLKTFGTLEGALTAYNAGPAAARRIMKNPEARTRFWSGYPRKVTATYARLRQASQKVVAQQGWAPKGTEIQAKISPNG